jgi:hypothetical protein
MTAIYTGCWFSKLPPDYIKVGVSLGVPKKMEKGYRLYKKLAPGPWFNSVSPAVYRQRYFDELSLLDPEQVVNEIEGLADDRIPVLVCWERPTQPEWCHRAFISAWLADKLNLVVPECGLEEKGHGWQHPKLPPGMSRKPLPPVEPIKVEPYVGAEAIDKNGQVWTVVGRDEEFPDQAVVTSGADRRRISAKRPE